MFLNFFFFKHTVWHDWHNLCITIWAPSLTFLWWTPWTSGQATVEDLCSSWSNFSAFLRQQCFLCVGSLLYVFWQRRHPSFLVWNSCGKLYSERCVGIPRLATAIPDFRETHRDPATGHWMYTSPWHSKDRWLHTKGIRYTGDGHFM